MTPGITSGASINSDSICLPAKFLRSIRKALQMPIRTESTVTHAATTKLVQMLPSRSASLNRPTRPDPAFPRNQSQVKPRHGGAG